MRLRHLFLALTLACRPAFASEPITAPVGGASTLVKQPHVAAELIPEKTLVKAGESFAVILHLKSDPDWHTYWINPGDAGLATTIRWTLPPGFKAGPIQWPTPELHKMGPLITYGYGGDVYLLTTITAPKDEDRNVKDMSIRAEARWLVCQEECIPGKADLSVTVHVAGAHALWDYLGGGNEKLFTAARARLPATNSAWAVVGRYQADQLKLSFTDPTGASPILKAQPYFFSEQGNVIDPRQGLAKLDWEHPKDGFTWPLSLQQNGEKPDHLSGVVVSDQPLLMGGTKAVYISSFAVSGGAGPDPIKAASDSNNSTGDTRPPTPDAVHPLLIAVLGAAFLGGLILNLMPCVLPVLSLKVLSLVRHAGNDAEGAWKQGAAFTAGVVISFWILAGLLIALRATGNHLGWGFQMQSPGFVLGLIFLFFLLGLNLFGVFELGTSLVGLDVKATGQVHSGLTSSFLNGTLATLAATPCTAPFMGSSVGFAAQQPAWVAMLIFTVLALGMATPYLLLTIFPAALRFVPKPGAWMEALKQFMGFLLLATVIFLVYVFGALVGQDQVPYLLCALLTAGLGAWIYGRWGTSLHAGPARFVAVVLALLFVGCAVGWSAGLARATPPKLAASVADGWQPWTPAAVQSAQAAGRPAFVDFTAAWCLSCKVNEKVALESATVQAAFAEKKVALFRADWTQADPAISAELEKYHRNGVPLYLYYPRGATDGPKVLPEVLTPGLVLEALNAR